MKKLRPSGGYRETASFQTATLIYDATVWFCEKFLDPRSRTVDQMVQAARSGRQSGNLCMVYDGRDVPRTASFSDYCLAGTKPAGHSNNYVHSNGRQKHASI